MTRVAFTVFGGATAWTGGINYLRNLVSALAELPGRPVEALLFVAPGTPADAVETLRPFLARSPVLVPGWAREPPVRLRRLAGSALLQRDAVSLRAFEAERVDVVFQHAAWYGLRFPLPTLAWVADFQHKHLPQMFSAANRWRRDLGYEALSWCADEIMLSSEDARRDCERFFPRSRRRLRVLPFAVRIDPAVLAVDARAVAQGHGLPERFFYMPNQLWRHKNHLAVIEALRLLSARREPVVVAASGSAQDPRNPDHPQRVFDLVRRHGLEDSFRFLGLVPYTHIMPLMGASHAVLNPSLFEGWSTTVEEAKALGVPLVLSDLAVHHEQTAGHAVRFFDRQSPAALADALAAAWAEPERDPGAAETAMARYGSARRAFAEGFVAIVQRLARR